jgi:hypothetical protein
MIEVFSKGFHHAAAGNTKAGESGKLYKISAFIHAYFEFVHRMRINMQSLSVFLLNSIASAQEPGEGSIHKELQIGSKNTLFNLVNL